ncbi:unnamed protein product, partial [Didymodactylos carnosus]
PTGAGYNTSANGWMEDNVFYEWFKNMFLPLTSTTPKPILLILDGHTSHRRVRTTELAISNGIVLLCIPPHSTHIFQPLDVTFFKPIKQKYREILAEYYAASGYEKVSKSIFPSLLLKLFQSTAIKKVNIIKGFIATGIYPLDKSAIPPQKILKCNQLIEADIAAAAAEQETADTEDDEEPHRTPKKKSTISATIATTPVPDLNTSEWDKDTSMLLNDSSSLLPPLNTSVWDHNATIRMDLSRASESTIEVATTSLPSLGPRAAICNALLSMRPPVIEQPPTKKVVLDRQAGQLLTCEEALRQMREKEELAAKKVKPVQKRTSVKQKKNSKAKKLSTIEDGMLCCLIS